MNELMTMENMKTMTSLEVAELTNKDHKNIIRDIKDEISKLGGDRGRLIFEPSEYTNNQNKKQPVSIIPYQVWITYQCKSDKGSIDHSRSY